MKAMNIARLALASALVWTTACGSGTAQRASRAPTEIDTTVADGDGEAPPPDEDEAAPVTSRAFAPLATSERIPVHADDALLGSPAAPVTIVAFLDFECPFCGRSMDTVRRVWSQYGEQRVRIVFKHMPLPFHKNALPAARAAEAVRRVAGNDAFFRYAGKLFENLRMLSRDNLLSWADEVGADSGRVAAEMDSEDVGDHVDRDMRLARSLGVTGTPAFFINGAALKGAMPFDDFRLLVDHELGQAKALHARGLPPEEIYAKRVDVNLEAAPVEPAHARAAAAPRKPKPVDPTTWKVPIGSSPVLGPKDAIVTIVQFSDYQCPFCKRVQPTLDELMKRYAGDLRIVFKHNPLSFHTRAKPAANLAVEAFKMRGNSAFWRATELLFRDPRQLEDADLQRIGKELKLSPWRVTQAIQKDLHRKVIERDQALAQTVKATGTPHFFINGRRLSGAQPVERFAAVIDEELAEAKELVTSGTARSGIYAHLMKTAKTPPPPPPPSKKQVPTPTAKNPSRGRGPIVVQMFSEFQCPFCSRAMPTIEQLEKRFPGRIKLVWRNLPLPFHKDARLAAAAALEAHAQQGNRGFWKMADLLFKNQRALKRNDLVAYASQLGLDVARFEQALDDGRHDAVIDADEAVAKAAGIRGTPGFVINGFFVSGAHPLTKFEEVVKLAEKELRTGQRP